MNLFGPYGPKFYPNRSILIKIKKLALESGSDYFLGIGNRDSNFIDQQFFAQIGGILKKDLFQLTGQTAFTPLD